MTLISQEQESRSVDCFDPTAWCLEQDLCSLCPLASTARRVFPLCCQVRTRLYAPRGREFVPASPVPGTCWHVRGLCRD